MITAWHMATVSEKDCHEKTEFVNTYSLTGFCESIARSLSSTSSWFVFTLIILCSFIFMRTIQREYWPMAGNKVRRRRPRMLSTMTEQETWASIAQMVNTARHQDLCTPSTYSSQPRLNGSEMILHAVIWLGGVLVRVMDLNTACHTRMKLDRVTEPIDNWILMKLVRGCICHVEKCLIHT